LGIFASPWQIRYQLENTAESESCHPKEPGDRPEPFTHVSFWQRHIRPIPGKRARARSCRGRSDSSFWPGSTGRSLWVPPGAPA